MMEIPWRQICQAGDVARSESRVLRLAERKKVNRIVNRDLVVRLM